EGALGRSPGGPVPDPVARLGRGFLRHRLGADGRWRKVCEVNERHARIPSPGGGGSASNERSECEPGWGDFCAATHPTPTLTSFAPTLPLQGRVAPSAGRGRTTLIHLDPRLFDHRRPAREITIDLCLELGCRVADRLHDLRGEFFL